MCIERVIRGEGQQGTGGGYGEKEKIRKNK